MSLALPPSGSDQPRGSLVPFGSGDRLVPAHATGGGAPATEPPALHRSITPGAVLAALRRRWQTALGAALVLSVTFAVGVWNLRPDKYTSYSLIRVASAAPVVLREEAVRPTDMNYTKTQLALIKSRLVLNEALKNERVLPFAQRHADPVEWLEKELVVEQVPSTEIIRVSMTSRGGGAGLKDIVDAVTNAYLKVIVTEEKAEQKIHLGDLKQAYAEVEGNLKKARQAINNQTERLGGGDGKILALRQSMLLEESASLKKEIAAISFRIRELDTKIAILRLRFGDPAPFNPFRPANGDNNSLDALIDQEVSADKRVVDAEAEVTKIRGQIQDVESLSHPGTTLKSGLERSLVLAIAKVKTIRAERREQAAARAHSLTATSAAREFQEYEAERGLLKQQHEALSDNVAKLKSEIELLGIGGMGLEQQRSDIERNEKFLQTIWEQKERLVVELGGGGEEGGKQRSRNRVSRLSQAEDAAILNKNGRLLETAGAGVAGFMLGLLAVAVLDLRRNRIHSPADISKGLRLRVIGALPTLAGATGAGGAPEALRARGLVESIDALRTTLLHLHASQRGTALMVASSEPGEGKTTLATALAASLARSRRRTLLIDGDLRAPSLHRLYGVPVSPGVCELLTGTVDVEAAIRPTAAASLDVMTAGDLSPAAAAALAAPGAVRQLIDELRGRYSFIVIDSSPLLLVPDAMMMAGCVDGLLYSVRPGVSRAHLVHLGCERLHEHRFPLLGVVVNGVPMTDSYAQGYGRSLVVADEAVVETGHPV